MVTAGAGGEPSPASTSWALAALLDYVGATAMGYPKRMLAFARFALAATAQALRARPRTSFTPPPRR